MTFWATLVAYSTSPCAAWIPVAASPTTAFAFVEAAETVERPPLIAVDILPEKFTISVFNVAARAEASESASAISPISRRASESEAFALFAWAMASLDAVERPLTLSRASDRFASTLSIWAETFAFDASNDSCDSAILSLSVPATTDETVETNVSLIVLSRVEAPVSVIFGATGLSFSFT